MSDELPVTDSQLAQLTKSKLLPSESSYRKKSLDLTRYNKGPSRSAYGKRVKALSSMPVLHLCACFDQSLSSKTVQTTTFSAWRLIELKLSSRYSNVVLMAIDVYGNLYGVGLKDVSKLVITPDDRVKMWIRVE